MPDLYLMDAAKQPIHRYEYYIHLRTSTAWHVPLLHGRMPRVPDVSATSMEKGMYGLCLMVLFRPHRAKGSFVNVLFTRNGRPGNIDDAWAAVYNEFERWRRDEIDSVAAVYENKRSAGRADTFADDTTQHVEH